MAATHPLVLVIAGSDSSAGAGMQRDLAVLASENISTRCAVTAITAQSDNQVACIHQVPGGVVAAQINLAIQQGLGAIKVGMLGTRACVETVATALAPCADTPIVLDPVLASTSGRPLLEPDGVAVLRRQLAPLATVVTPNLAEAALLLETEPAATEAQCTAQAQALVATLSAAVLLKGGHAEGKFAVDLLALPGGRIVPFSSPRLETTMRGTGCALSSLIAAALAQGDSLEHACKRGKEGVYALLHA